MAYVPIDESDVNAPHAADAVWSTFIANDTEAWNAYEPAFEATAYPQALTAAREFRFRVRGGDQLESGSAGMTFTVGVYAASSGAAVTVSVGIGGYTYNTTSSITTAGWYETNPIALAYSAEPREVVVSNAVVVPTMTYYAIRCIYGAGSATGRYYASGYRNVASFWSTANRAVPTEVLSRLRNNPVAIAKSRPICVVFRCGDTTRTITTKSEENWGVEDQTSYAMVGRALLPHADREERTYIVDAYTTETVPGSAEFTIKIGGTAETWSGPGWHSWTVRVGGGMAAITAAINPGNPNEAAIRTLQVWRAEP